MEVLIQLVICLSFTITTQAAVPGIRMQRDFKEPAHADFPVFWNVPTFICHKHNILFEETLQKFGIITNKGDVFRQGNHINIMYDPGMFPAMLKNTSSGRLKERNGGIPQLGDITLHLTEYRNALDRLIPENFKGLGVIDFEAWRPVFRQHWKQQVIYKDMSKELERQKHPQWKSDKIEHQAKKNFEAAARIFMETTLNLTKLLRPNAQWGYYAFPYCYNYRGDKPEPWCHQDVLEENNQIHWLWSSSTALYPSLYMSSSLSSEDHRKFVIGRLNEAWRVASRYSGRPVIPVHPYFWYKYYDSLEFLSEADLYTAIETTRKYKMGGLVLWGATKDVTSKESCSALLNYLNTTLGPAVSRVKRRKAQKTHDQPISYQFVPLQALPPSRASWNYSYRTETRPERTPEASPSSPTPPPRLEKFYKWYEGVLNAIFTIPR